jgi:hypothetical protein
MTRFCGTHVVIHNHNYSFINTNHITFYAILFRLKSLCNAKLNFGINSLKILDSKGENKFYHFITVKKYKYNNKIKLS